MDGLVSLISFASIPSHNKNEASKAINHLIKVKNILDDKNNPTQKLQWDGLNLTKISSMDDPDFQELSQRIKYVDLSNNLLSECPKNWKNWDIVTHLYLDDNKLIEIEKDIFEMRSLTTLSLNNNCLRALPKNISLKTRFQNLYLKHNELVSLPDALSNSLIDELCLDYNKFESLPRCVCKIPHLTYLSLDGNKGILDFPLEMGQMDPSKLKITLKDMDQVSDCYNYLIISNIHYIIFIFS